MQQLEPLGINLGFLIGQIVNFLIFFFIVRMFAWKPIINFLDARSEKIAKGLEDARVAEEARTNAEAEAKRILDKARAEAQQVVAEARSSAEERARPIIEAANQEADLIRTDARQRAEEARVSALGDVRGQVVSLAIAAANKLIGESMSQQQQERIVNEFFSTASTQISGLSGDLVVTTALPLDDKEKSRLEKDLGGNVVEWRVDPSILGGVVVRSGDRVLDGSVRSGLNAMAARLN